MRAVAKWVRSQFWKQANVFANRRLWDLLCQIRFVYTCFSQFADHEWGKPKRHKMVEYQRMNEKIARMPFVSLKGFRGVLILKEEAKIWIRGSKHFLSCPVTDFWNVNAYVIPVMDVESNSGLFREFHLRNVRV